MVVRVLKSCVEVLSRRGKLFAAMNMLYFASIFVVVLLAQFLFQPMLYEITFVEVPEVLVGVDWPLMLVGIFLFNLALSGFLVVTLPGLVFFPLSAATLAYRASLWGLLLSQLPTPLLLAVLPTLMLEGEAYVFAGVAGVVLGLSWLKPEWIYEPGVSRSEAFKRALRECGHLYIVVAIVLLAAAIVETATIVSL